LAKHDEIDTKNLFVIKALQSLTSRGYAKTQFSWQYYYYTLTDEGVEYLREWLHLPSSIVPDTHKKQARAQISGRPAREDRRQRNFDNEGSYRRRNDKESAPGEYNPQFNQ
jgi:small subunit ribosomal protein S10e